MENIKGYALVWFVLKNVLLDRKIDQLIYTSKERGHKATGDSKRSNLSTLNLPTEY